MSGLMIPANAFFIAAWKLFCHFSYAPGSKILSGLFAINSFSMFETISAYLSLITFKPSASREEKSRDKISLFARIANFLNSLKLFIHTSKSSTEGAATSKGWECISVSYCKFLYLDQSNETL